MSTEAKAAFFDGIADRWDGWEDLPALAENLSRGLDEFGVAENETILDVGCGTGNLTRVLLSRLSHEGRVVAIDISQGMIEMARMKIDDARVTWHVSDAKAVPVSGDSVDRIICFSVWPHFDDPEAVIEEWNRLLRPSGSLHVWHLSSRDTINEIHASAGDAVAKDVLVPATDTARLLQKHGLEPCEIEDNEYRYLVSARKPRDAQPS